METEVRKVEMSENVADPTGLGLLGLAVVCFVVSTSRVGWSGPTTSVIIHWAVLLGSLAQMIPAILISRRTIPSNPLYSAHTACSGPLWLASGSSKWGPLAQRYRKALM